MSRSRFDENRDQRTADDAGRDRRDLMCAAHGCPNLWSLASSRTCRWHTDASPAVWPRVTQELLDAVADQARGASDGNVVHAPRLSFAQKSEILDRLRAALSEPRHPRLWIAELKGKDRAGIKLSRAQRHALACVRSSAPVGEEA